MGKDGLRGLGSVYRRGRLWWIRYYHHGQEVRRPAETTNRARAVKFLNEHRAASQSGRRSVEQGERLKFRDLVDFLLRDYRRQGRRSINRAQAAAKHLTDFFRAYRAVEIQPETVNQYIDRRQKTDGAANATIKLELSLLKRMLHLAEPELGPVPTLPSVRVSNIRKGFFEEAEYQALLEHVDDDLKPIVKFLYLTGWRMRSEVFTLQWSRVNFDSGEIRLEPGTTKTDEGRTFPLKGVPELEDLLRRQREHTDRIQQETGSVIPWVFHRRGRQIRDISRAWRRAVEAAAIGARIPHDFRRTAVHNLERAGVSRSVAMRLVGHKTENVYRRYAIVAPQDLVDGVKRLSDCRAKTTKTDPKTMLFDKYEPEKSTGPEKSPG